MKTLLTSFICLIFIFNTKAQSYRFNWNGACSNLYYNTLYAKNDRIYLLGDPVADTVDINPAIAKDIYVKAVKSTNFLTVLDSGGNYLFSLKLRLNRSGYSDIVVDDNQRIIVCGWADSTNADLDPGAPKVGFYSNVKKVSFVAIYDKNGSYITHFEYPFGSYYENLEGVFLSRLAIDKANNLYMTGNIFGNAIDLDFTGGTDTFSSPSGISSFFTKVNLQSSVYVWSKVIETNAISQLVVNDKDTSLIIGGNFTGSSIDLCPWGSGGVKGNASSFNSAFLASYNQTDGAYRNGGVLWAANSELHLKKIVADGNNHIYTLTTTDNDSAKLTVSDVPAYSRFYGNGQQNFIVRYNNRFFIDWVKLISSKGSNEIEIEHIACNNNFICAIGSANDSIFQIKNKAFELLNAQPVSTSDPKRTLLCFRGNGSFFYEASERKVSNGGSEYSNGIKVSIDFDNNVYLVSNGEGDYDQDHSSGTALNTTIDPDMAQNFGSSIVKLNIVGFVGVKKITKAHVIVYPNPAINEVYISIPDLNGVKSVKVYNELGQVVYESTARVGQNILECSGLNSGIYYLVVEDFDSIIHTEKLVVLNH